MTIAPRARFSTHVAWTFATRLLMLAGGICTSVIVARTLGAGGLGALAVLSVTVAVALQLGSAGLPSASTYFIAQDRRNLAPVCANSLIFALTAGAALTLSVIALARWRPALFGSVPFALIAIAAAAIPFQLVTLLGLNIFLGINRIAHFNGLDAAAQVFALFNAVIALLVIGAGLNTLVALNTAAALFVALLVVWMIARTLRQESAAGSFRPAAKLFQRMALYGLKFHIALVASLLIFRSDLLIVNHFRGAAEAGVYAVASQVAMMLMLLPGVIGTLLFPRITATAPDARAAYTMRATRHTAFIMLFVCAAAAPASLLLPLLYGAPFGDATVQLLILLPGICLVGVESVLVQHFSGLGMPVAIPIFWLIALLLNVLLNLMFVPSRGARAAAVASAISYALLFLLVTIYFRRQTGNKLTSMFLLRGEELRDLFQLARTSIFWR